MNNTYSVGIICHPRIFSLKLQTRVVDPVGFHQDPDMTFDNTPIRILPNFGNENQYIENINIIFKFWSINTARKVRRTGSGQHNRIQICNPDINKIDLGLIT